MAIAGIGNAQILQKQNNYGFEYKRMLPIVSQGLPADTFALDAYQRTFPHIAMKGANIYLWSPSANKWQAKSFGGGNLQEVTESGNKTTLPIYPKALGTNTITADTSSEADFTIVVFPDIQGMTYGQPAKLYTMFDWVVANKTTENIKAVLQLGDLTDRANIYEYVRVDSQFKRFDTANIPYQPVLGNHDYDGGEVSGARLTTKFNTYFGVNRFTPKAWFGGNYPAGSTDNYYIKLAVGKQKLLFLGLEFMPMDNTLAWAKRVCDSFPDWKVIVSTHAYLTAYGERSVDTSWGSGISYGTSAGNSGEEMWNNFIRKTENISVVLSAHFIDLSREGQPIWNRSTVLGDAGNVIHQVMVNYQRDGNGGNKWYNSWGNDGNGWFMKMRFSPSKGKIYNSYYSSWLNQQETRSDSFDLDVPHVQLNGNLGVSDGIYAKDIRASGSLYLDSLRRYAIPYIGLDHRVKDTINFELRNGSFVVPSISPANLVSTRIPYISSTGTLRDSSNFYFNGSLVTAPGLSASNLTNGRIPFTYGGKLIDTTRFTYDGNILKLTPGSSDDFLQLEGNSGQFIRQKITNLSAGAGAAAGIRMVNNAGNSVKLYMGSTDNGFAPNGALLSTGNGASLNISTSVGFVQIGRDESVNHKVTARFTNKGTVLIGDTATTDTLSKLQVTGNTKLKGAVYYKVSTPTDADYTVTETDYVISLPALTSTDRTITLPDPSLHLGRSLLFYNSMSTGSHEWIFSNPVQQYSVSTPSLYVVPPLASLEVISIGSKWVVKYYNH